MEEIMWGRESLEQDEQALEESRKVLEGGGVIVFPTDTIYGLGAKAVDEAAIRQVYRIKGREEGKPVSILVRDMKMARRVACIDSRAEQILEKVWPGSVTVVLRKKDLIPYALTAGGESVAVRISDHPFVEALFGRIDFPITATSANISGKPDLYSAEEIRSAFQDAKNAPDLFINAGDLKRPLPSTIIDLTDVNNPRLLRMGAVGKDKLGEFFKNIIG
jgi:L-threonylcarbamoyladenylate synthase